MIIGWCSGSRNAVAYVDNVRVVEMVDVVM